MVACIVASSGPSAAAPRTAPDFTWTYHGQTVHLTDLRGHIVIVNFFATWCPPCRDETPTFVRVSEDYADKGVYFVGVDTGNETASKVTSFARNYGIGYQLIVDDRQQIGDAYGVTALPTTFIVDPNGALVYHSVGEIGPAELTGQIEAYLNGAR